MVTATAAYAKARQAALPRFTPVNNIIFDYGHSFVARGYTWVPPGQYQSNDYNILAWACTLSKQRFVTDYPYSSGVVGDSIAQALTRLPLAVGSAASTVLVQLGTNDCNSAVPLATMQAGYLQIINALVAAGKTIIVMPILPNYSYFSTAAKYQLMEQFNLWLIGTIARCPNTYVVDAMPYWTDLTRSDRQCPPGANGTVNALNYTIDNLHPSARGAFAAGLALAATLDRIAPLLPPAPMLWTPFNNFDKIANPNSNMLAASSQLVSTGGSAGTGVSGTLPAGYTVQRAFGGDITAVGSIVAKALPNGQSVNMQQLMLTNPGTTAQAIKMTNYTLTPANYYTPGSAALRGGMDVEVDAGSALCGIDLALAESGAAAVTATAHTIGDYSVTSSILPTVAWAGRMRTPPLVSAAGNTALALTVRMMVPPGAAASVRLGNVQIAVK